jgi:hypothetical protein
MLLLIIPLLGQIDHAIVIVPQIDNSGPVFQDNCYENALNNLGIPFDSYLEGSDFLLSGIAIQNADPDHTLVIVDSWFLYTFSWSLLGLDDFIINGGRVIFSSFNLDDDIDNADIRALLGVSVAIDDNPVMYNIYDWSGNGLFTGLPDPIHFDGSGFMVNSTNAILSMTPMIGSIALGGFMPPPQDPSESAIILSNGGKTLTLGACIHMMTDFDDCIGFAENMIVMLDNSDNAIPAMTDWGIFILFLIMSILALIFIKRLSKRQSGLIQSL